jgi:hypothetical protein
MPRLLDEEIQILSAEPTVPPKPFWSTCKVFIVLLTIMALFSIGIVSYILYQGKLVYDQNDGYETVECSYYTNYTIISYSPVEFLLIVSGNVANQTKVYAWSPFTLFSSIEEATQKFNSTDGTSTTCFYNPEMDVVVTKLSDGHSFYVAGVVVCFIPVVAIIIAIFCAIEIYGYSYCIARVIRIFNKNYPLPEI